MFSKRHVVAALVMLFFLLSGILLLIKDDGQPLFVAAFICLLIGGSIAVWLDKQYVRNRQSQELSEE